MANKTSGDVYRLITDLRLELKSDIKDVAKQVEGLTTTVANNELKQAISTTKLGALITGITILSSGIVTVIVNAIIGGHK